MQVGSMMTPGLAVSQPELTAVKSSEGGLFQGVRRVFFRYDPVEGTQAKFIPCALATATASTAGAAACDALVQNWTPVAPGAALTDRFISVLEKTVKDHPLVCGAAVGMTTTVMCLNMLGSSLKPLAKEAVLAIREEMRHQLDRDFQNIAVHKVHIAQYQKNLSKLETYLRAEKEKSRQLSEEQYKRSFACYQRDVAHKVGQLRGFVDSVLSSNPISQSVNLRENNYGNNYKAGIELSRFVEKQDYSYFSQQRLLRALEPVLSEGDYKKVNDILSDFPSKPYPVTKQGPIAREYSAMLQQSASEQRKVSILESTTNKVLGRYPNLRPDADGNIPKPLVEDFARYMPE